MDLLKTVFGIDVSSRKSNVCIMVNGQKVNDYAISNDMVGFNQLLDDLKQVANCKNKLNTYHNIWQILTIYAGKCGQVRCQSTLLESCSLRSSEEESCTIPRS